MNGSHERPRGAPYLPIIDRTVPMTRAPALERLSAFLVEAGAAYAGRRNTDRGAGARSTTSVLSPYLRGQRLTEAEVVEVAFGEEGAGEFVSPGSSMRRARSDWPEWWTCSPQQRSTARDG